MTWDCTEKKSTRRPGRPWVIFRRRSRMWDSLARPFPLSNEKKASSNWAIAPKALPCKRRIKRKQHELGKLDHLWIHRHPGSFLTVGYEPGHRADPHERALYAGYHHDC